MKNEYRAVFLRYIIRPNEKYPINNTIDKINWIEYISMNKAN